MIQYVIVHLKQAVLRPIGVQRFLAATIVALLGVVIAVNVTFSGYDSTGGTVDGVSWTGEAYSDWSQGEGIEYDGQGLTSAAEIIDHLKVYSYGVEYCGFIQFDSDWAKVNDTYDDWIVGETGEGWAMIGECSWWIPHPHVIIANETHHYVWEDGDSDSGETDGAWDDTGF